MEFKGKCTGFKKLQHAHPGGSPSVSGAAGVSPWSPWCRHQRDSLRSSWGTKVDLLVVSGVRQGPPFSSWNSSVHVH